MSYLQEQLQLNHVTESSRQLMYFEHHEVSHRLESVGPDEMHLEQEAAVDDAAESVVVTHSGHGEAYIECLHTDAYHSLRSTFVVPSEEGSSRQQWMCSEAICDEIVALAGGKNLYSSGGK